MTLVFVVSPQKNAGPVKPKFHVDGNEVCSNGPSHMTRSSFERQMSIGAKMAQYQAYMFRKYVSKICNSFRLIYVFDNAMKPCSVKQKFTFSTTIGILFLYL